MKIFLLLLSALVTIGIGCKKDKTENPQCRITKLTNTAGKEIKITYDGEGRYSTIDNSESGEATTIEYNGESVVSTVRNKNTGMPVKKITLIINNTGMASSMKLEVYDASGTVFYVANTVYEYNGTNITRSVATLPGITPPAINTFNWTNGNMTSSYNDNLASNFEYYIDRPTQQGDWFSIITLIYNSFDNTTVIKNRNLLKNYFGSVISYRLDDSGKIDAIYTDGNLLYRINYECN